MWRTQLHKGGSHEQEGQLRPHGIAYHKGDSGGPLVGDGVLQGTTSWGGNPCAWPRRPSMFTELKLHKKWIEVTVGGNPCCPCTFLSKLTSTDRKSVV